MLLKIFPLIHNQSSLKMAAQNDDIQAIVRIMSMGDEEKKKCDEKSTMLTKAYMMECGIDVVYPEFREDYEEYIRLRDELSARHEQEKKDLREKYAHFKQIHNQSIENFERFVSEMEECENNDQVTSTSIALVKVMRKMIACRGKDDPLRQQIEKIQIQSAITKEFVDESVCLGTIRDEILSDEEKEPQYIPQGRVGCNIQ